MFKMTPNYSAEVMSSVPKFKKIVICLAEKKKLCALNKLLSGMNYSAIGQKFNVNKSALLIILITLLINQ